MKSSIGILSNASYGSVIVPPDDSWELGIVFGNTSETDPETISGWNTFKRNSTQVTEGVTFTDIKDIDNNDLNAEVEISGGTLQTNPIPALMGLIPPSPNLFRTSYTFNSVGTVLISNLNDSNLYTVTLFGISVNPSLVPSLPDFYVNGILEYNYQCPDLMDQNFKTNITYIKVKNISPVEGTIEVTIPPAEDPFYFYGLYLEQYQTEKEILSFELHSNENSPVPYAIRLPSTTTQNTPVIISLGFGGTEGDGTKRFLNAIFESTIFKALIDGTYNGPRDGVILTSPQFYENIDNAPLLHSFIEYLAITYNINPNNVYLMGFSAGMENSLSYIGNQNYQVRAAALGNSWYFELEGLPTFESIASTSTPLWLFSATGDTVVAPSYVEDIRDELISYNPNYPIRLSIFNGGHHAQGALNIYGERDSIPPIVSGYFPYNNGEIYDWLLSHASSPRVFQVGNGSGNLTIDGSLLGGGLISGDIINIVSGSYTNLNIINIDSGVGFVTVKPQVLGGVTVRNLQPKNVIGLKVEDILIDSQGINNVTLDVFPLKNITLERIKMTTSGPFAIRQINPPVYNPNDIDGTVLQNFTVSNCEFIDMGYLSLGGDPREDTGRVHNLVIINSTFKNRNGGVNFQDGEGSDGSREQAGSIIDCTNAYNYDFNGNYFYKIATLGESTHKTMIYVTGVGVVRNNKAEKYYGQIARQGLYAKEEGQASYAYNNIGIHSFKYSILEGQVFSNWQEEPNWKPQDYHCYFNTAVNIGINESGVGWQAVIVDIYNLRGGNAFVHNNLAVDVQPRISGGASTYIFWGVEPAQYYTNFSFDTIEQAGLDLSTLIPWEDSPIKQEGTHLPLVFLDQLGRPRANPPTVGALEALGEPEPEPEPLPVPNSPQSIYNILENGSQSIFLTNKPIDAQVEWRLGSTSGTLISSTNPTNIEGILTENPDTFQIYVRYYRGSTFSTPYVITINVFDELPEPDFDELVKLTINIEGLPTGTDYSILRNGDIQPNRVIHLPLNTEITEVTLNDSNGYKFIPNHTVSVLMDQDRTVTFTATPI